MDTKDLEYNLENDDIFADNIADDVPKEQVENENPEEDPETTDNASEELEKMKDSFLRLMAEYDNYRKRTIKEKADLIKNGGEKVLIGLLSIADDFQRALENVNHAKDLDGVKEGVDLIYQKFLSFLQQNGVKAIESVGKPFDADLFEAIATIPTEDEEQKGTVIDNIQTGYTLNDKVIRHAKVVVAN
jgi:molecular chaperone GrpE